MGARIAAMAHHPNDGNHAGTNLPTPLPPPRSLSALAVPPTSVALSFSAFRALTSAIFR